MKIRRIVGVLTLVALTWSLQYCEVDDGYITPENSGYPKALGELMVTKCAIAGCHTPTSKAAASGLDLSTWEAMMNGGDNGAVTIPGSHEYSTLFLFCNHFEDLGEIVEPTMPYGFDPLSREELEMIRDWIDDGAKDINGKEKFPLKTGRDKLYVTNQGCELMAVLDQETGLVMKYFKMSKGFENTVPHSVKVSPNKEFVGVVFNAFNKFEVYDTYTDSLLYSINIGEGNWNTMAYTSDSKYAFLVNYQTSEGSLVMIDMESQRIVRARLLNNFPHGVGIVGDTVVYVTAERGNVVYKMPLTGDDKFDIKYVYADESGSEDINAGLDMHEIFVAEDYGSYYLTCVTSNEVRVMNAATDALEAVIPVGKDPREFARHENLLFVSCMDDDETFTGPRQKGSIYVIDLDQNKVIKSVYSGFQPHGMAVDVDKNQLVVVNRNFAPGGPAPHHSTECGGNNGYLSRIDLTTLELIPGSNVELSNDPYVIDILRHD